MLLSEAGGAIASGSNKQKLNTRSSTESEVVASDDFLPKILLTKKFMEAQRYPISSTLFQDNQSSMILETKGRSALGKRIRAIDVRFFHD